MKLWAMAVLLWLTAGCATTRVVNLDTGRGRPVAYTPAETKPVRIDEEAFKDAVTQLVLELKLDVAARENGQRSLLASAGGIVDGVRGRQTLRLNNDFPRDPMSRWTMALSFALDTVWAGVADAVEDLMNPAALRTMVTAMIGTAMVMLVAPEPITKLVAVVLTASLIAYLGTGPVWNLGQAFLRLMDESRDARDEAALKEAGHRFGRVLGDNGARVLVIVAMTALGGRNAMAAQAPRMPGFPQAVLRAEAEGGFLLSRALAGEVRSISVSSAGVLNVTLAPTAVAAVAMGPGGGGIQGDPEGDVHHICTDKNEVSEQSGGPWTPIFEDIFQSAGMKLSDTANQVRIQGHRGPHPREYHAEVLSRLRRVMLGCQDAGQCRAALVDELARIAKELVTAGTKLRKLITKNPQG
ncbi:AHH domain-containing protein [Corallococcus exiguus]|uniref:AHH domain-containing protein n=1 Tax=Corallococcus exiguus TaxID=83462 RepID=UPI0014719CAE|nr:AHH domain-containing protein [Corallococcus exiguus]NNB87722.1 AHH domain-containing protein [Corallococcus exiguus]NNC03757.1 AHH domain-containing protein [Corallococcus exiguus]